MVVFVHPNIHQEGWILRKCVQESHDVSLERRQRVAAYCIQMFYGSH